MAGGGGEFVAEFDEPAAGEEVGGFNFVGIVVRVVFAAGADMGCDVDGPKGGETELKFSEEGIPSIGEGRVEEFFDGAGDVDDKVIMV